MEMVASGRTCRVVNRTSVSGFGNWVVQHFLNGRLICETKRNTRREARAVARKYRDTGMIPLN